MKTIRKAAAQFVLLLVTVPFVAGCGSAVDASRAYSRGVIDSGMIVPADKVRIHEYLNHYEQRLPEPVGQPLGLDVRLGNPRFPASGGEVWAQIGLQAQRAQEGERTPLNLVLVLDVSGSMDDPKKMPYLRRSLNVFLEELQPQDQVGIVAYADEAVLLRPAESVDSGAWIPGILERLRPGGSTNLNAGLILGMEEVERTYDVRRNNRVILLTDGIANVGVTDPERIASSALVFNQRGIYLSTIGLGLDMNDDLLSTLARQGHGAYHFVDSAQEIDKVFRQEVAGLLEKVAEEIRLAVETSPGVSLTLITGLDAPPPPHGAQVVLQDMGAGDSQVVLVRLETVGMGLGVRTLARATLSYFDNFGQRMRETTVDIRAESGGEGSYDPMADVEVRRSVTIVRSAETLRAIDRLWQQGEYEEAWVAAADMERELREMARIAGDPQLVVDADLFRRYQLTLAAAMGYDPGDELGEPGERGTPSRWGAGPGPGSTLPPVEVR